MSLNLKFRLPVAFLGFDIKKIFHVFLKFNLQAKNTDSFFFPRNNPARQSTWKNSWPGLCILTEKMLVSVYQSHSITPSNEKLSGSKDIKFRKI